MISRDTWAAHQHGLTNVRSWITNFDNCFDQSGCFNKKQQQIDKKEIRISFRQLWNFIILDWEFVKPKHFEVGLKSWALWLHIIKGLIKV